MIKGLGQRVLVKCEICGKEEYVTPSRAKTYKTCSVACAAKRSYIRQSKKVDKICPICGALFKVKPSHYNKRVCCSKKCDIERRKEMYLGENNPNYGNRGEKCPAWKGGRRISNYGYVLLRKPDHPNARPDGYILEHRYVMSQYLGRPLRDDEIVHHKDGNRLNNDISNLELMTLSEHTTIHNKEKKIIRDHLGRIKKVVLLKEKHVSGGG